MAVAKSRLGSKKEAALIALLGQRSIDDAARVAGVGARTLHRWLKEPEFDAAYREARRDAFGQSTARLQQMCTAAVSTLGKIMVDPSAPAASRVRAADCVLDRAAQAIELEDIAARLSALERSVALREETAAR